MADNQTKIIISAEDKTNAAFNSVKTNLAGLSGAANTLNGVIGRLAPLLGAATFTAFLKGGIDTLDMLGDLSERTGVAASTLAGFKLVAAQSDTSLEALGKGLNKLSVYMAENGAAAAKLGITAKDPAEAFIQLSNVLSGIENPQQRAALANKILSKSYAELLPALLQGGAALRDQIEKGREYAGVTEESVAKAQLFNDQVDELSVAASGLGVDLATALLPTLNNVIKAMAEAYKQGGLLKSVLVGYGTLWKNEFYDPLFGDDAESKRKRALQAIPNEITELTTKLQNDINGSKPLSFIDRKKIELDIQYLAKEANNLKKELGIDQPASDKPNKKSGENAAVEDVINPGKKTAQQTLQQQIALLEQENKLVAQGVPLEDAKTIAKLKQQGINDQAIVQLLNLQQETKALADVEKNRADAKLQAIEDEKIFHEGDVLAIETEIELQNEQLDVEARLQQQRELAVDAYDKALESIAQETEQLEFQLSLQGLSKKDQEEKIAARNVEIALQKTLNDLAEQGLGLSAEEIDALRKKYTELSTLNSKVKENKNTAADLGLTFKSALEDAIVKGEDLGDVLDSLGEDLMRIATRRMLTDPLTKAVDSAIGSFDFGSIADWFTPNANGGVYSSPSLSQYSGSVVNKPTMFAFASGAGIMGEAGAEGIFPLKRGKDGKLGVSASGSGSAAPNVIINLIESPGNGGQVSQKQDGNNFTIDVMVEKIESMIGRNISKGRGIAPVMERQYGLNRAAGAY